MTDFRRRIYRLRMNLETKVLVFSVKWRTYRPSFNASSRALFARGPFSRKPGKIFVRYLRLGAMGVLVVLFISLFPCPHGFWSEERPFYGDFTWNTLSQVRLSAGDFQENGRGGLEHYIPRLRLIEYTVERGDTLWSISKKFDVDPDGLISSNYFTNVHSIHHGDTLLVPSIRGIFIEVKEGDTIFKFSTQYKIPPDFIMEVNDLRSNSLAPGMKIFLPGVRYSTMERAYALGEAFEKPVRGRLTSRYGYRRDPFTGKRAFHTGIDIAHRYGTEVHAARDGKVLYTGIRYGYGRTVIIEHSFGYKTLYGHLSSVHVQRGQKVKKGKIIGFIGASGRSTGPHLHFEVWLNGRLIDPLTQTNMTVR